MAAALGTSAFLGSSVCSKAAGAGAVQARIAPARCECRASEEKRQAPVSRRVAAATSAAALLALISSPSARAADVPIFGYKKSSSASSGASVSLPAGPALPELPSLTPVTQAAAVGAAGVVGVLVAGGVVSSITSSK